MDDLIGGLNNEAMQDLKYHFRLNYIEANEVVPFVAETAVEIVNFK